MTYKQFKDIISYAFADADGFIISLVCGIGLIRFVLIGSGGNLDPYAIFVIIIGLVFAMPGIIFIIRGIVRFTRVLMILWNYYKEES